MKPLKITPWLELPSWIWRESKLLGIEYGKPLALIGVLILTTGCLVMGPVAFIIETIRIPWAIGSGQEIIFGRCPDDREVDTEEYDILDEPDACPMCHSVDCLIGTELPNDY